MSVESWLFSLSPSSLPLPSQYTEYISKMASCISSAINAAERVYTDKNPKSKGLFETARASLPGGNTRTLLYTSPFPITVRKGDGSKLVDEDGNM